jgi:hypothetical protein
VRFHGRAQRLVGLGEICGELILVVRGFGALQVERLGGDSSYPLGLSLDGEHRGNFPGSSK